MPSPEDISRSNTPVDGQKDVPQGELNTVEAGKEKEGKGEELPKVSVEAPVVATVEEKQARIDHLTKIIERTNEELARVREGLGLPSGQQADVPSVATARENLAQLSAETATTPKMKEMAGGWKGNWKAGDRPEGYINYVKKRADLKQKYNFSLTDALEKRGWTQGDFEALSELQKRATENGELTEAETGRLLQFNFEMNDSVNEFSRMKEVLGAQETKKKEVHGAQETMVNMLKTNDVIVSKSGTRRVVEEVTLFSGADGGGIILFTTARGNEKPFTESLTFKQIKDGIEKGVLEIQKS